MSSARECVRETEQRPSVWRRRRVRAQHLEQGHHNLLTPFYKKDKIKTGGGGGNAIIVLKQMNGEADI